MKRILIFGCFLLLFFSFISAGLFEDGGGDYVSVDIEEGWNLISGISFSSELHSSSEIEMYGLISSYYFDSKKQERVEVRPIYSAGNISALDLYTNAFWVNSLISGKLVYPVSPGFKDKSSVGGFYQFYKGNNLIAINDEMYGKSVNEIKGSCLVNKANFWDAKNQEWVALDLDDSLDFESRDDLVGKGIGVNVGGDCKFFANESFNPFCGDGVCGGNETVSSCSEDCFPGIGKNKKRMDLYSEKSTFLISDENWRDVLPLVPVTTWTKNQEDFSNCSGGYGTPESVCTYPMLIYHEENFDNRTLELNKREFIKNTWMSVSWTFKDNLLARENVENSDNFEVLFNLSDDMYGKMYRGIPVGEMFLGISKIDSEENNLRYEIYLNGNKLGKRLIYFEDWWRIFGVFWGNERDLLLKGENNLTFKRTGGNILITNYSLEIPYFEVDIISDDCIFNPQNDFLDLCIRDVRLDEEVVNPGDFISYSIIVENIGNDIIDLSGTETVFGGPYYNVSNLGGLYKIPYGVVFSHVNTSFPKVFLQPGESTEFKIYLRYGGSEILPDYAFDADSIVYFMQQYSPDYVTLVGETLQDLDNLLLVAPEMGPGLASEQIRRIEIEDYLSYWESFSDVVYVKDNYELALLSASYASLINSPLIIQGGSLDSQELLETKNVVCVGIESTICDERYSLEQLEQRYINKTGTNKIILVNPSDLEIKTLAKYETDKSSEIFNIYTKDSLAAPILASAKHEILLSVKSEDYKDIDNYFTSKLRSYYEIPSVSERTCKIGDACSQGFNEVTRDFYIAKNKVVYNIPPGVGGNGTYNIFFGGNLFGCSGEMKVDLYNNGNFLGSDVVSCVDEDSHFFGFSGVNFADWGGNDVNSLEPGELELRFDNASFSAYPWNPFYIIEIKNGADKNGAEDSIFSCLDIGEFSTCASQFEKVPLTKFFSNEISYFNFDIFEEMSNYTLVVDVRGSDMDNIAVYFNGDFVGDVEYPSYLERKNLFKVSENDLSKGLEVRLVPNPFEGFEETAYYSAEVSIKPLLGLLPNYLTIISSPDSIPMSRKAISEDGCSEANYVEADGRIYGSLDNYEWMNFPVGRITGISSSDVSGYIARDIFFDELPKNRDALLVVRENWQNELYDICDRLGIEIIDCPRDGVALEEYARTYFWTEEIRQEFDKELFFSGHDDVGLAYNEIHESYGDAYLKLFVDHGNPYLFDGMMESSYLMRNNIYLKPSLVLGLACSTCDYRSQEDLFCMQGIRRGALAQQGAVDVSYWHQEFDNILIGTILKNKTIGEAYLEARNEEYQIDTLNFCQGLRGDPYYVLLGDPTWRPKWW